MLEENKIHCGDCMELMQHIPDKIVDMILCDLPYGTTACEWDKVLPLDKLWKQYERIIKDNGVIVLFSSQPFTSKLIMSNLKLFKYEWIWEKGIASGVGHTKNMPLKKHENICIFSKGSIGHENLIGTNRMVYNPQNVLSPKRKITSSISTKKSEHKTFRKCTIDGTPYKGSNYPKSVLHITNASNKDRGLHPTQKPLKLFRYLIKTYTQDGELVLDNCIGSGTTAVACKQANRRFIGIEINQEYVDIANRRLKQKTVSDFNPVEQESLIIVKREISAEISPNSKPTVSNFA